MYKLEYCNNCVHEKIPHGSKTKLKLSLNSHVYCDTLYICLLFLHRKIIGDTKRNKRNTSNQQPPCQLHQSKLPLNIQLIKYSGRRLYQYNKDDFYI